MPATLPSMQLRGARIRQTTRVKSFKITNQECVMTEFEIEGKQFRFEKLTAMQQFHVSRKIAPLIPPLLPVFDQIRKDEGKKAVVDDLGVIGPLLQPFADGLAGMSDEASEYVFGTCLGAVRYQHNGNWIQMWSVAGKVAMVMELNDVSLLLRIVVRVIQESLAPFLTGLLTNASEPEMVAERSTDFPEARTGS
jgi:hypothetical protein